MEEHASLWLPDAESNETIRSSPKSLPDFQHVFPNEDAFSPKHLRGYLNEFVFRFNRRFWPLVAFDSVLKIAARVESPTYTGLYKGTWGHPRGSGV